jgi:hypothetical protein
MFTRFATIFAPSDEINFVILPTNLDALPWRFTAKTEV